MCQELMLVQSKEKVLSGTAKTMVDDLDAVLSRGICNHLKNRQTLLCFEPFGPTLAMLIGRAPFTRSRHTETMPRFSLLILVALLTVATSHRDPVQAWVVLLILATDESSIDACQWIYEHREAILTRANAIRNRTGRVFCYA